MFAHLHARRLSDYRHLLFALAFLPLVPDLFFRIEGPPLLPPRTIMHYVFAAASALAFLSLIPRLFANERYRRWTLASVFACTAVLGMLLLSGLQWLAAKSDTHRLFGSPDASFLWHLGRLIAYSYQTAADPDANFLLSLFGFTFGIGFCEEFAKILPVWFMLEKREAAWNAALVTGLVSGVAFGVAEGVHYSEYSYNGVAPLITYLIRFVSCVALHAAFTGGAALFIERRYDRLSRAESPLEIMAVMLVYLLPTMLLHGLYDTFLKVNMLSWSVLTAFATFGWLALQIELSRAPGLRVARSRALPARARLPRTAGDNVSKQAEVDRILAKISASGICSLSRSEKKTLQRASEEKRL